MSFLLAHPYAYVEVTDVLADRPAYGQTDGRGRADADGATL